MSNKTTLQNNNTLLANYVSRVNVAKETAASLPEAGSGGGSSGAGETCTVTFVNECVGSVSVFFIIVETDGTPTLSTGSVWIGEENIYENVLCNTRIRVDFSDILLSVESVDGTSYAILNDDQNEAKELFIGTSDTIVTMTDGGEGLGSGDD